MKISFVTFADHRYKPTLERIRTEALNMNVFDDIYVLSDLDFDEEYKTLFFKEKRDKMYAFGFYCWKSWAVKSVMDKMEDGNFLVYADAGCIINNNGDNLLIKWLEKISVDNDFIAFQQKYAEEEYTKEDVFQFFKITHENNQIRKTGQFFAGAFILRKNKSTANLVEKWFKLSNYNFQLIDDSIICESSPNFLLPRYDQSIISLLLKSYEHLLSFDMEDINDTLINRTNSPIIVARKKRYTIKGFFLTLPIRIVNKLFKICLLRPPFKFKR